MNENTPQNTSSAESLKKVTLLRCWTASFLSGGLAIALYFLMMSIVQTYANKPVTSANPVVVNLTAAVRTIVIGMAALGTGVFGLVAIGLFLLGIQVAIQNLQRRFSQKSGSQ